MERILTYAVLGLVGVRLASAARISFTREGQSAVSKVRRRIRWRHVWPLPLVFTGVVTVATLLMQIPFLAWGWWSALGGQGNPIAGSTDQTSGTALEWIIPLVFLLLLFPALPLFALAEERIFRLGAEGWSWWKRAWKTLAFGMVHALIGIPIGVALALCVSGSYFMSVYLRRYRVDLDRDEAVLTSAAVHTLYNAIILGIVLIAVALTAFGIE